MLHNLADFFTYGIQYHGYEVHIFQTDCLELAIFFGIFEQDFPIDNFEAICRFGCHEISGNLDIASLLCLDLSLLLFGISFLIHRSSICDRNYGHSRSCGLAMKKYLKTES